MSHRIYASLYERLVANTVLERPDDPTGCWLWTGSTAGDSDYPRVAVRVPGRRTPLNRSAGRAMLEEFHDIEFPWDDAGHLWCSNPKCISPLHMEVQAPCHNHQLRGASGRRHKDTRRFPHELDDSRWIPVIYPRSTHPDFDPDLYAGEPHPEGAPCPF